VQHDMTAASQQRCSLTSHDIHISNPHTILYKREDTI